MDNERQDEDRVPNGPEPEEPLPPPREPEPEEAVESQPGQPSPPIAGQPVQPRPGPQMPPRTHEDTTTLITLGWISAALGIVCCCCAPVFGIVSIILGAMAYSKGDQRGLWVIIAGVVVLILGSGLGIYTRPWWMGPFDQPRPRFL